MTHAPKNSAADFLADLRVRAPGASVMPNLPPDCRPDTIEQGYRIQDDLRRMLCDRGLGPQVGWKIGCTTPVMQEYLNIPHPCAGTLYRQTLYQDEVTLRADDFFTLGLECEIAVVLSEDLPATRRYKGVDDVQNAIGGVMASIEIVEHRFADFANVDAGSLIADDFFSAGCVVGKSIPVRDAPELDQLRGGFVVNGAPPVGTGSGAEILGHPLLALAWLANHAADRGMPLRAGHLVTLGSVVKTIYPRAGQTIEARFTGLPIAVVTVT